MSGHDSITRRLMAVLNETSTQSASPMRRMVSSSEAGLSRYSFTEAANLSSSFSAAGLISMFSMATIFLNMVKRF